jgi:hypothetical protein
LRKWWRRTAHTALEAGPNAVIKSTLHAFRFNAGVIQGTENLLGDFPTSYVGIRLLIVVARKSIETRIVLAIKN